MGVREPVTQPLQWCHRMVVVRKHDGTLRRCVNLQPATCNHCQRKEWVTTTPSKQARSVPRGTYNTVTDAWNSYHRTRISQTIGEEPLTFLKPWVVLA